MEQERLVRTIEEVRQRNRFISMAWQGLQSSLNGMDTERAFFHIHAVAGFSRQLEQMLWNREGEGEERARALCRTLEIDEEAPAFLAHVPDMLDGTAGRFERWMDGLGHARFLGMNIMPRGTTADFRQDEFLRSLDPETMVFSWQGSSINLKEVHRVCSTIESATDTWLRRNRSQRL